jgi:hypothetical protein
MEKAKPPRRRRSSPKIILDRESAVYDANFRDWLGEHEGEYVLIKGDEVVGFFEARDDAIRTGYERFGVVPIFVKEVTAVEPVYNIPNGLF